MPWLRLTRSSVQSEEDQALKEQLELYVLRAQDADPGVQKLALESMRYSHPPDSVLGLRFPRWQSLTALFQFFHPCDVWLNSVCRMLCFP